MARVTDARNQGFRIWNAGASFSGDLAGAQHMNDWNIQTWKNSIFRIHGSWVPLEPWELSAALGMGYDYPAQVAGVSPTLGLWDAEVAGKYTWPLEFWHVGLEGRVYLPTRSSALGGGRLGGALTALSTTTFDIYAFHLNLGLRVLEQPAAIMAGGAEMRYQFLNPYLELCTEVYSDSIPVRLTPGVRIITDFGLSFYYASDFGLNPAARTPDIFGNLYVHQVSLGASYTPGEPRQPRRATLVVQVKDAVTGEPLPATVIIPGHYPGNFVISEEGERVLEVHGGRYQVTVSAPGYLSQIFSLRFSPYRRTELHARLEPDRSNGRLVVKVADAQTGEVIPQAEVRMDSGSGETDARGEVHFNLEPGTYNVEVVAPGYVSREERVSISADLVAPIKVSLLREDARMILSDIQFASGSHEIPPRSYHLIDEVADVLKKHPRIRLEIQGHTDSQGEARANMELSLRRAQAVRSYLIDVHQISPDRLIARGYGEEAPLASNQTPQGRAQNRRVEVVVISE